jgi:hypothetical protein
LKVRISYCELGVLIVDFEFGNLVDSV